ncbi:hypothetical protein [Qipengyuania atrilutea]|uniref:Uncharacterized protein n=1 Tax=Qipengyuania atrilutea TaxID=2744473 RepID=A0A850GY56_9SPHN|nr:hypothetical protein [Actirhodobacter atriluteus]NVD44521.1 hypothetical protein [Actirhodobacter atriluteus]
MRPNSIRIFEKLFLGSLVIGLINAVLSFAQISETLAADPATEGMGTGLMVTTLVITFGINLLLWYFVARKASNIAKWILVAFTILGLLFLPSSLAQTGGLTMVLSLVVTAMQVISVVFLFRQDAKVWFAGAARPPRDNDTTVRMK